MTTTPSLLDAIGVLSNDELLRWYDNQLALAAFFKNATGRSEQEILRRIS